mmetsp:Transcript_25818/g.45848  ORF Transcript_25818/g.45848 Transcript_25818/m.45848 type:complete len:134 (+) Transcript_25818:368-769(+)
MITNATVLIQESATVTVERKAGSAGDASISVSVFGTNFFWPARGNNPYYDRIKPGVDIVVSHGPAKGYVDDGHGCQSLATHMTRRVRPRLVVSGHIHSANGTTKNADGDITFVNAAICRNGYTPGWDAVVVDI